jgi:hypothetical protein
MAHKALAFVDMEIPLTSSLAQTPVEITYLAPKVEARILQDCGGAAYEITGNRCWLGLWRRCWSHHLRSRSLRWRLTPH